MQIYLVYIQDFHGYICNICYPFSNREAAQRYIEDNQHLVAYRAFTTARGFKIKELTVYE